jgi:hypothetical protein
MGTGALAMPLRGIWEFRGHNLFAATFRAVYACFLFTTALILQFYAPMITDAAGATNFSHMFGAYLIVWALFTAMLAVGARYINAPAFTAFVLLVVVYVLLGIGNLVGSAGAANALMKARAVLAWSAHWPRPLRGNPPQRRERAHPVADLVGVTRHTVNIRSHGVLNSAGGAHPIRRGQRGRVTVRLRNVSMPKVSPSPSVQTTVTTT